MDRLGEFKNVRRELLPDTRAFSGYQDSPGSITILDGWDPKENHIKYMTWRDEIRTKEALAGFVEAGPVITYYDTAAPASQM